MPISRRCTEKSLLYGLHESAHLHVAGRHPLYGQRGPGERVRVEGVVKQGRVLLPDLVLFEDALLFDLVDIIHYNDQSLLTSVLELHF